MHEEETLVREAQKGNAGAFARLYESYFDRIYRYMAVRVGNSADAEDLAEEVFLKALESIGTFQWRGAPFSAWLFRIAHNLVIDRARSKGRKEEVVLDEALPDTRRAPEDLVELKISIEQMLEGVHHLTDAQRQVIALRFASGLSIIETAQVMNKNEGAIKALQHSAVQALRRILTKRPARTGGEP
ncbi:MAG: sigma-70 family RNA polymerase sigma factor [Chloroflexi bacterium]|nr:sigma-70 family RNA polymerase sigma factor [Chloroflexota bacterium]